MSSQRKHILYLPKWYPNMENPYHGIFVHRHAAVAAVSFEVFVLFAKASPSVSNGFLQKKSIEDGVHILRYYYPSKITGSSSLDKLIKLWWYVRCMAHGLRTFSKEGIRFDIAHVHVLGRTGLVAWWLKKMHQLPYVITEHFSGYFPERNSYHGMLRKWLDRKVCKEAHTITTVSHAQQKAMQQHGLAGHYAHLPNVVDTHRFVPATTPVARHQWLVVADQDDHVKNISGILRAFEQVARVHPSALLTIIGDGVDAAALQDMASKLTYAAQIRFLGAQPQDVIVPHLHQAYGLVLFSHFENAPCVLAEANACGVPVIATQVGGVAELVTPQTGILVAPRDEKALAEAMLQIMEQPDAFDASVVREWAQTHFSHDIVGKRLTDLYNLATQ